MKAGLEILNRAVIAEDATHYNEPSDWDLPVRELLGGALLLNQDYANAEKVFRAEIEKHQRNGRALFGLSESLKSQGKNTSAQMVWTEFEKAWQTADTKLTVAELAGVAVKPGATVKQQRSTDPQFSTVALKTGIRFAMRSKVDPSGKPVIMLHGYTDSWFSYSTVLPCSTRSTVFMCWTNVATVIQSDLRVGTHSATLLTMCWLSWTQKRSKQQRLSVTRWEVL